MGLCHASTRPGDGRLARISLTPLGRDLESKCARYRPAGYNDREGGLGEENAAEASAMLRALASAFRHEEQRLAGRQSAPRAGRNARPPRPEGPRRTEVRS